MATVVDAARAGDTQMLSSLLSLGVNVLECDEKGYTAAHWTCYNDDVCLLCMLLDAAPELIHSKNSRAMTCLHVAASNGSIRCIRILLDNRSFVSQHLNAVNHWGESALHLASATGNTSVVVALLSSGLDYMLIDQWGRTAFRVDKYYPFCTTHFDRCLLGCEGERVRGFRNSTRKTYDSRREVCVRIECCTI